jgi:ABC-type Fe3+ transport system permease subunit
MMGNVYRPVRKRLRAPWHGFAGASSLSWSRENIMAGPDYEPYDDYGERRTDIPNYLVQAILVTLCCCWPLGIVNAAQVNSKLQRGDIAGAEAASNSARTWCWVSFILGLVGAPIAIAIQLALSNAGNNLR